MNYWGHQNRAHESCRRLFSRGLRSWCVVAPPGAGKSVMMMRIAQGAVAKGKRVAIYLHRIMLTRQTIELYERSGMEFGVVASSFSQHRPDAPIQICSLDTVHARLGKVGFRFPNADVVLIDERHQQSASMAKKVFARHREAGAVEVGYTATPVGLKGHCQALVNAGDYTEMLDCGAHLPVRCYGPDRPDLSGIRPMKSGDFSSEDDKRINRVPTIYGRVRDYWRQLNPLALPAVGFAPGTAEARWFVHHFQQDGVPCASIDSKVTMLVERNGCGKLVAKEYTTDDSTRREILEGSAAGAYKIVWNRFILREAIDLPAWYHLITATSMGAISTYLQSTGRVLRSYDDYSHVIYQDHSGNIDRHGLPNENREWELSDTNASIQRKIKNKKQDTPGNDAEPICCPKCCSYRLSGPRCHNCGYSHKRSVRMVRQVDGTLVRQTGRNVKYKRPKVFDDLLRSALFAGHARGATCAQAMGHAKAMAKEKGVKVSHPEWFPDYASREWDQGVRRVFPGFARKR